jgi:diguanylate cyclase (GGDEF)-like protein
MGVVGVLAGALGSASTKADGLLDGRGPGVDRRLSARELNVELAFALAFVATGVAILAGTAPVGDVDATRMVLLVGACALLTRVRFPLGPGLVAPTQVVFVPMVFLLPVPAVPLLVAAAAVTGELPEIVRRRAGLERAVVAVADSWYAVGPVLVIAALGPADPSGDAWAVYLLALAAQFAVDLVASTLREWLGAGVPPASLVPVLGLVYLVDVLLTPVGLLAVLATGEHPYAFLLAFPSGALLALIARERSKRIARELELGRAHRRSARLLARQTAQLRQSADELARAHRRVGEAVASTLDREALHGVLLTGTVEAVHADCGRLSARAPDGSLGVAMATGEPGRCAAALDAVEARAAELAGPGPWLETVGEATALAVPLGGPSRGDRRRKSDALIVARTGRPFSTAERDLLDHLAGQAAVSLENLELHELVQRQAATDELTGLLNHRHLHQVLDQTLRERGQRPVALLMLDIDDFKLVNDAYGHQWGDRVLTEVAGALRAESRPFDHAGRYGGEELALVLPGTTLEEARVVAERVRAAIAALGFAPPAAEAFRVTASVGIAEVPACARDRQMLVGAADAAMYAAKRAGKNRTAEAPLAGRFARPERHEPRRSGARTMPPSG